MPWRDDEWREYIGGRWKAQGVDVVVSLNESECVDGTVLAKCGLRHLRVCIEDYRPPTVWGIQLCAIEMITHR